MTVEAATAEAVGRSSRAGAGASWDAADERSAAHWIEADLRLLVDDCEGRIEDAEDALDLLKIL